MLKTINALKARQNLGQLLEEVYYLDNVRLETGFRRGIVSALKDRSSVSDLD